MRTPPASVVVRTHRRPQFLRRALQSVISQGVPNVQVVVVNNGGEIDEVEREVLAQKIDVTMVHLGDKVSRGKAANEGLRRSTADYVVFHDDDDTWNSEFLHSSLDCLERTHAAGVICRSDRIIEEVHGDQVIELRREPFFDHLSGFGLTELTVDNCFTNLSFLVRRDIAVALGGYHETLNVYEDWDFNLRFFSEHEPEFLSQILAHYHSRPSASGSAAGSFKMEGDSTSRDRARLIDRWITNPNTQAIGLLLALGPLRKSVTNINTRVDKAFNALNSARNTWPLSSLWRTVTER
jgi:glycosyltransferase involved in cell wall biosynthesis